MTQTLGKINFTDYTGNSGYDVANKLDKILETDSKKKHSNDVEIYIEEECDAIKELLISKNRKYGNSTLEPQRIFSKASTIEQLLVRIDDKLSRIKTSGTDLPDEDTVQDLIGYLILLRVAHKGE